MRASAFPRSMKFALGAATFAAGVALMVLRPGVALAHHVTIYEQISCSGWEVGAEYIGGPDDRKVVVDVTINGEQINQTFYFDNGAGHLGHVDSYPLYERAGTGSLVTSGSVKMYARSGGAYTVLADSDYTNINLQCAGATSTPTPQATSTATSTPPATETAVPPTSTPPATETAVGPTETPESTSTPVATATNTPESNTPEVTATVTTTTQGTVTPLPTNTPEQPRTATPPPEDTPSGGDSPSDEGTPESTPTLTLVDEVMGSTPESQGGSSSGSGGDTGTALPSAGDGSRTASGLLVGLLGLVLAGSGLSVVAAGLRERR